VRGAALPPHAAELFATADAVLLDPRVAGALGGTGTTLDWDALADAVAAVRGSVPLVLAGGLTPENVARAAATLAPAVVDVSSGVESAPGVKDPARMTAFVAAVRPHRAATPAAAPL
jgi:phosphoribosylanthranilate isomerase